jgi:hypothetical protein
MRIFLSGSRASDRKHTLDIVRAGARRNKRNIWRYRVPWSEAFYFMESASARKQRSEPESE